MKQRETSEPSVLHPSEMFSSQTLCFGVTQDICYENVALHLDFTFFFPSVSHSDAGWRSWNAGSHEKSVSVAVQKISVNPTEQP